MTHGVAPGSEMATAPAHRQRTAVQGRHPTPSSLIHSLNALRLTAKGSLGANTWVDAPELNAAVIAAGLPMALRRRAACRPSANMCAMRLVWSSMTMTANEEALKPR